MFDAVIFDFDGVIADSEPVHYRSFRSVLESLGKTVDWERYRERYLGFDDREVFRKVFDGETVGRRRLDELVRLKAGAFQSSVARGEVRACPGAVELVEGLHGRVTLGLCSGGLSDDILPVLDRLGLAKRFGAIVTAEDTPSSKPDPAPYRLVLRRLGLDRSARAAAIEDSNAGIASARAAGLRVLAVTHSHDRAALRGYDAVTDSLVAIGPALLSGKIFCTPC